MGQPSTAITTTRLLKVKLLQITATANTLKMCCNCNVDWYEKQLFLAVQF